MHAVAGLLFSTLFGSDGQPTSGREKGAALEEDKAGHSQHESQEQRMQQGPSQPPTAEQVVASDGQATDEEPVEADASIAEAEADLARAQRAQREALQAEAASLESSCNALLEVKETMLQEQGSHTTQSQDQDSSSSKAQTDIVGRQGGGLPPAQEADREADDSMLQTGAVLSDEEVLQEGDSKTDESVVKTEAALTAAQEAEQQVLQAEKESLAEKPQSSVNLRDDLQQASGQPAQSALRHEVSFTCTSSSCPCLSVYHSFKSLPYAGSADLARMSLACTSCWSENSRPQ